MSDKKEKLLCQEYKDISKPNKAWFVYILECMADDSYYIGITNDFKKRLKEHTSGTGAKYTKGRGPFIMKHLWFMSSKSSALKEEIRLKKFTRKQKEQFINNWLGTEKHGEFTEHTRWHHLELIALLQEKGWSTENIVDNSNPGNQSTYILWHKGNNTIYVGNYFLQSEGGGVLPWKDAYVEREEIENFLTKSEIK